MTPRRPICIALILGFTVAHMASYVRTADAAIAAAGSGFWAARNATDTDSSAWVFGTPTAGDVINWGSGPNETDGAIWNLNVFGPEPKFNTTPPPPPTGRTFTGFVDGDGPGPLGSTTVTAGAGSSGTTATQWGTVYVANWAVTATGALGTPLAHNYPSWESQAFGDDPFSITPAQLSDVGITEPAYDLYFAAELTGAAYSLLGSVDLAVIYETASGETTLLSVALDKSGAAVANDGPPNLTLYNLSSLVEGPTENPLNITSLLAIEAALDADVADWVLDSPMTLGFILDDLPVPTQDLGDGSVARIRIELSVAESELIPEPGTLGLLAFGACLHLLRRRR